MRLTRFVVSAWLAAGGTAAIEANESICFGTTARGALEGACELPAEGSNFSAYSTVGRALGRTYLHCRVVEIVTAAYGDLATSHKDLRFVYAETGLKNGGEFKPHRTHQNGLSIDFMVPVRDRSGASVPLPTSLLNNWGYGIEFTPRVTYDEYRIDFEAMAQHLAALVRAARSRKVSIAKVIFDPELQPMLKRAEAWKSLEGVIPLSPKPSWIRHDEHYHVDFAIPCEPLR